MVFSVVIYIFLSLQLLEEVKGNPIIQTTNGTIQGSSAYTISGNNLYYYFWGIPYATPPTGKLRFQPPQAAQSWSGTLDGTLERNPCVQYDGTDLIGSEDCLYLDVYTPQLQSANTDLLPVLIWIHGGYFVTGYKDYSLYGPDYLLDNNVVYVAINYRLGPFGFLSTGDSVCPGNNGIKDIIRALGWIQDNIASFGGDPNSVTIFGQGSGGAIVHYLLQSPLASGLFHKAISTSGTSLNPWALSPNARDVAFELADTLGIIALNSETLLSSLVEENYKNIQNAAVIVAAGNLIDLFNGLAWAPVIEPNIPGAVITEASYNLLSSGQYNTVPYLLGFTSNEASAFQNVFSTLGIATVAFDLDPTLLIPNNMNVPATSIEYTLAADSIKNFYFGLLELVPDSNQFINYSTESFFVRGLNKSAQFHSYYAPTYLYRFSFGDEDPNEVYDPDVSHDGDLPYYFNSQTYVGSQSAEANQTRKLVTTFITNFVKNSDPTPPGSNLGNDRWITARSGTENMLIYYDIGSTVRLVVNPNTEGMTFWQQQYDSYGIPPYTTY